MKFKSSKPKIFLLLLVSVSFAIAGWLFRQEIPMFAGYVLIFFCTLGFILSAIQLLPGASLLEFHDKGFSYTILFRKTEVPWKNIGYFYEVHMQDGKTKKVGWHYSPEIIAQQGTLVDTSFPHGMLPDSYGMKASELVSILNDFKMSKAKQNA